MDGATIATFVVAVGTVVLAWATFRLGSRAEEQTRAQWRPVLLIRARRTAEDRKILVEPDAVAIQVENVGRGPALDVTATGMGDLEGAVATPVSAIAPREVAELELPLHAPRPEPVGLTLNYGDISQASYTTVVLVDIATPEEPRLIAQQFEMREPATLWWQRIVPRGFRKHLWPLTARALRRRGYKTP